MQAMAEARSLADMGNLEKARNRIKVRVFLNCVRVRLGTEAYSFRGHIFVTTSAAKEKNRNV